jgi:hypothetical protein
MAPGDLIRQAQNEATLRFGPQRFALKELIAQALQARDMALHAAAGAERGIQASIAAARGETARTYAQAAQTTTGTRGLVDQTLANLGAGATPFAAAIARERGGATDRLTEGKANTLQELTQRRLEASSGRAFATQHATDQFNQDLGKVQRGYQEVASEQGAFVQGRTGELRKEAADRKFQRDLAELTQASKTSGRGSRRAPRSAGRTSATPTGRRRSAAQGAARKRRRRRPPPNRPRSGVGSLTQGEENDVKDSITKVVSIITNPPAFEDPPKGAKPGAKGPRLTHQRMLQHLRNGTNPLGEPQPDDIIQIAYDLRDNGGVLSSKGIRLVHSRGMHVPKEWLPKKRSEGYGPTGAVLPGR